MLRKVTVGIIGGEEVAFENVSTTYNDDRYVSIQVAGIYYEIPHRIINWIRTEPQESPTINVTDDEHNIPN
jgi:hypothetical protein